MKHLNEQGVINTDGTSIMIDDTDSCANQYRCGNVLYLLSMLSAKHKLIIDRAAGAPGHGKDVVDGLNVTGKNYLHAKMCMIGTPEANSSEHVMNAHSTVNGTAFGLAQKYHRLCSHPSRTGGYKGGVKNKKREQTAKMKARVYYLQNKEDVEYIDISMNATGFDAGKTRDYDQCTVFGQTQCLT